MGTSIAMHLARGSIVFRSCFSEAKMSMSIDARGRSKRQTKVRTPARVRGAKSLLPKVEMYTDERIAEFILNNAVDGEDYLRACAEVRKLGIDPEKIGHFKPLGVV